MVYDLVRNYYAAFNLSDHYFCFILSNESIDTLSKIFPVNIQNLRYGSAKDLPLLSKELKITAFLTIVMLEEIIILLTPKFCYEDCKKILNEILIENDYKDESIPIYLIEGPEAAIEIGKLINEDVRSLEYYDSVQFSFIQNNKPNNICLRCSFFGEIGFLLLILDDNKKSETNYINHLNFHSFNDEDVDTLVNEANSKVFNKSVFKNDCPIEVGLSHVLDFADDQFCFHLELNKTKKNNKRRLVAVEFKTNPNKYNKSLEYKGSLYSVEDGSEVGVLLRTFYSKTIDKLIGYAIVNKDQSYLFCKLSNEFHEVIKVHKAPFFITKSNFLVP